MLNFDIKAGNRRMLLLAKFLETSKIVEEHFEIIDAKFQHSNLVINEKAMAFSQVDSISPNHVVQMLWCKRK